MRKQKFRDLELLAQDKSPSDPRPSCHNLMTWDEGCRGYFLPPSVPCHVLPSAFPIAVVKNPPNNLWIIAAVLAPIAVVTVIIIIITAVLCRKNKNDFKPDTMMNLPQRAKVREAVGRDSACLFSVGFWGHCKYLQKHFSKPSFWRRPFLSLDL